MLVIPDGLQHHRTAPPDERAQVLVLAPDWRDEVRRRGEALKSAFRLRWRFRLRVLHQ